MFRNFKIKNASGFNHFIHLSAKKISYKYSKKVPKKIAIKCKFNFFSIRCILPNKWSNKTSLYTQVYLSCQFIDKGDTRLGSFSITKFSDSVKYLLILYKQE